MASDDDITAGRRRFASMQPPEGWQIVRLGEIFAHIVDRGHTKELPVLAVTIDNGVIRRDALDRRSDREVAREEYLRVRPGDLAYNTMRMWQGASGLVRDEGYVSPAYTVVRPRAGECSEFWAYYFRIPATIRDFLDHSQGFAKDRYRLYFHHFATVPALRPNLDVQRTIAVVLSSADKAVETARTSMARYALLKRRLLRKLIEELKVRGVPTCPMAEVGELQVGQRLHPGVAHGPNMRPYLRVANVLDGHLSLTDVKSMHFPDKDLTKFELRDGDILLNEGQSVDLVGRSAIYRGEIAGCCVQNSLQRYRCGPRLLPEYAHAVFQHWLYSGVFASVALKTTSIAHLTNVRFLTLRIPVPPLDDQKRIVDQLASATSATTALEARAAALSRIRLGLMQDLFSGRRRVNLSPEGEPVST